MIIIKATTIFRSCITAALLLLYIPGLVAQGIYEVRYNFNNDPSREYSALIFYYSENATSNQMRIRYYAGGWNIAEQNVEPIFFQQDGKDYWVLRGSNPTVIDGPKKGTAYYPDKIFLSKKTGQTYYEPDFVNSPHPDGTSSFGKILSFKVLTKSDVTDGYLSSYNWHWNTGTNTSTVGTLHVILVTNTNDRILGKGFARNHELLAGTFGDVQRTCHMNIDVVELTGFNFTKDKLKAAISNLSVSSNDVVFFYYSGHGYNDRDNNWPHLDMRQNLSQGLDDNSLSLSQDVYTPLTEKKARLTIVIGDCCNKYRENSLTGTPVKDDPIMMAPSQNMLNASMLNTLLSRSGKMLIRASDVGEPSYYTFNYGGNFCHNFISSLVNEISFVNTHGDVTWKDIFSSTASSTLAESPNSSSPQHVRYHNEIDEK